MGTIHYLSKILLSISILSIVSCKKSDLKENDVSSNSATKNVVSYKDTYDPDPICDNKQAREKGFYYNTSKNEVIVCDKNSGKQLGFIDYEISTNYENGSGSSYEKPYYHFISRHRQKRDVKSELGSLVDVLNTIDSYVSDLIRNSGNLKIQEDKWHNTSDGIHTVSAAYQNLLREENQRNFDNVISSLHLFYEKNHILLRHLSQNVVSIDEFSAEEMIIAGGISNELSRLVKSFEESYFNFEMRDYTFQSFIKERWSNPLQVVTLAKTSKSWDGTPLPKYLKGDTEITILKITVPTKTKLKLHKHPVINGGVLLKGELTVVKTKELKRSRRSVKEMQCYWMENHSGKYNWIPYGSVKSKQDCYKLDSCDGGLGYSGGGCYKWAESSDSPREPWKENANIRTKRSTNDDRLHLKAGQSIVELVDEWHYGINEGSEPVEIIIFYAGIKGTPITVLNKDVSVTNYYNTLEEGWSNVVDVVTLAKTSKSWDGTPLPKYPEGDTEVTILKITIPPKTRMKVHKHPVINAGVLLKGELSVITETNGRLNLKAGQSIVELVEKWHYGINEGNEPVEIIIFYAGIKGTPITVLKE